MTTVVDLVHHMHADYVKFSGVVFTEDGGRRRRARLGYNDKGKGNLGWLDIYDGGPIPHDLKQETLNAMERFMSATVRRKTGHSFHEIVGMLEAEGITVVPKDCVPGYTLALPGCQVSYQITYNMETKVYLLKLGRIEAKLWLSGESTLDFGLGIRCDFPRMDGVVARRIKDQLAKEDGRKAEVDSFLGRLADMIGDRAKHMENHGLRPHCYKLKYFSELDVMYKPGDDEIDISLKEMKVNEEELAELMTWRAKVEMRRKLEGL